MTSFFFLSTFQLALGSIIYRIPTILSYNSGWLLPFSSYENHPDLTFDLADKNMISRKITPPPTCFVWFQPNMGRSRIRSLAPSTLVNTIPKKNLIRHLQLQTFIYFILFQTLFQYQTHNIKQTITDKKSTWYWGHDRKAK